MSPLFVHQVVRFGSCHFGNLVGPFPLGAQDPVDGVSGVG